MTWTSFMDMASGGGSKEDWQYIYIEAPEVEARVIFYNRFGHNPARVSCTCCGQDYSIDEDPTLEEATAYERGCTFVEVEGEPGGGHYEERPTEKTWGHPYAPLSEYIARADILVIPANEIKDGEQAGEVPEQGYVWAD